MMNSVATARRPARQHAEISTRAKSTGWPVPILDADFDPSTATVWTRLSPFGPVHVSKQLLSELTAVSTRIREGRYGLVRYKVISSNIPNVFSLGGDLELFLQLIDSQDKSGLFNYGRAAIDEVWANITGCGVRDLMTVALVNGEAQGGGFEAALSCHVIVAERGTNFGFPESLFGLFPGMGASSLLAARTDEAVANRLVSSANRYSAEFLYDIGVIDYLVPRGSGIKFVSSFTGQSPTPQALKRKSQLERINFNSLLNSVEYWVAAAMQLCDKHKRSMNYLLSAQRRAG